jgi:hypothetical protein
MLKCLIFLLIYTCGIKLLLFFFTGACLGIPSSQGKVVGQVDHFEFPSFVGRGSNTSKHY